DFPVHDQEDLLTNIGKIGGWDPAESKRSPGLRSVLFDDLPERRKRPRAYGPKAGAEVFRSHRFGRQAIVTAHDFQRSARAEAVRRFHNRWSGERALHLLRNFDGEPQ